MAKLNFGGTVENVVTRDEFPLAKAQEVLKNDGIYSGPIDGRMSQSEAIRSFQQSHQLNMTGTIDDETARELGLQTE